MNWIKQKQPELTTKDKIISLLRQPYKLVLVQQHELERIKILSVVKTVHVDYVDRLYKFYIVDKSVKFSF